LLSKEQKESIDWSKIAVKSLENFFNEAISLEDLKQALLDGYRIAAKKKKRFIARFLWNRLKGIIERCFLNKSQRELKQQ
jgi:hypothetical protein